MCCWRWAPTRSCSRGSLRLSLGHTSTQADVDAALRVLPAAVDRARQAALASSALGGLR